MFIIQSIVYNSKLFKYLRDICVKGVIKVYKHSSPDYVRRRERYANFAIRCSCYNVDTISLSFCDVISDVKDGISPYV